jgi:hypothetical protein
MFGPEPGKGGSLIVARTASTDTKPSRAVVDHDCYTIANWDEQKRYAAPSRRRALNWAVATAACMCSMRSATTCRLHRRKPKTHSGADGEETSHGRIRRTPARRVRARQDQPPQAHRNACAGRRHRERAKAELKSPGVENVRDGGLYSLHMTDPFGYDVQISVVGQQRAHRWVRFFSRLCAPAGALGGGVSTTVGIRSKITKHRVRRLRRPHQLRHAPVAARVVLRERTDRPVKSSRTGQHNAPALWPIGSLTIVPTRFVDEGLTISCQAFSCA